MISLSPSLSPPLSLFLSPSFFLSLSLSRAKPPIDRIFKLLNVLNKGRRRRTESIAIEKNKMQESYYVIAARMIKISCDNANNCTLGVMSCLGNFTCVLWVWKSNCSIPTVHPCILRNCGGITQSLAFIVWMLPIIMSWDDCLDDHDFVVHLVCLRNVESQIVKLSFVTWSLDLWHDLTCLLIL